MKPLLAFLLLSFACFHSHAAELLTPKQTGWLRVFQATNQAAPLHAAKLSQSDWLSIGTNYNPSPSLPVEPKYPELAKWFSANFPNMRHAAPWGSIYVANKSTMTGGVYLGKPAWAGYYATPIQDALPDAMLTKHIGPNDFYRPGARMANYAVPFVRNYLAQNIVQAAHDAKLDYVFTDDWGLNYNDRLLQEAGIDHETTLQFASEVRDALDLNGIIGVFNFGHPEATGWLERDNATQLGRTLKGHYVMFEVTPLGGKYPLATGAEFKQHIDAMQLLVDGGAVPIYCPFYVADKPSREYRFFAACCMLLDSKAAVVDAFWRKPEPLDDWHDWPPKLGNRKGLLRVTPTTAIQSFQRGELTLDLSTREVSVK